MNNKKCNYNFMKIIQIYVEENDKNYDLVIGQNQNENDKIIKSSSSNDIWFHLDKLSGPHFVFKTQTDEIPKKYLNQIAVLFREYKNGLPNRYTVIYTYIKNVKLTNTPGLVIPCKTKNIKC